MYRIKCVEEIFAEFSFDKSAFSVIHIDRNESEACFPFVIKPAASDKRLHGFFKTEEVHDQQENVAFPAIIRIKIVSDNKKRCHTYKLHILIVIETFDGTKRQVSEK